MHGIERYLQFHSMLHYFLTPVLYRGTTEKLMVSDIWQEVNCSKAPPLWNAILQSATLFPDVELAISRQRRYNSNYTVSVICQTGGPCNRVTKRPKVVMIFGRFLFFAQLC